jgi:hypothetical protein
MGRSKWRWRRKFDGMCIGRTKVYKKCSCKSASTCFVYEGRILAKTRYLKARQMRFEK